MESVKKLYIDIETIPSETPPSLDEIEAPSNYKNEEAILKYKTENQQKLWEKQALNPLKGKILCIGYAINDEPADIIYDKEESVMIAQLEDIVKTLSYCFWIGHNVSDFDLIWIYSRAIKYRRTDLKSLIPQGTQSSMIKDTMKMFTGPAYWRDNRFSLKDICRFLNIKVKSELSGDKVFEYYQAGKINEILAYCKEDVSATRKVYKMINN